METGKLAPGAQGHCAAGPAASAVLRWNLQMLSALERDVFLQGLGRRAIFRGRTLQGQGSAPPAPSPPPPQEEFGNTQLGPRSQIGPVPTLREAGPTQSLGRSWAWLLRYPWGWPYAVTGAVLGHGSCGIPGAQCGAEWVPGPAPLILKAPSLPYAVHGMAQPLACGPAAAGQWYVQPAVPVLGSLPPISETWMKGQF